MYYNTETNPLKLHKNNYSFIQSSGKNIVTSNAELNFSSSSTINLRKKLNKISINSGHQIKLSPPKTGIPEIKSPILMKNNYLPGVKY